MYILQLQQWPKHGLESNKRVQQIYGKDVNRVDEIYNEIMAKDTGKIISNVLE